MKTHKVLFFGPFSGSITGQSVAFKEAYNNFDGNKALINTTKFSSFKVLNSLYCLISLPIVFSFHKFTTVYFTCSRSKLGALKDIELLLLCKLFDKKVVNHLHGADFKSFYQNSGLFKFLIKYCYKQIDLSIVLLPSMRDQFSDFPEMRIDVVENCYDTELDNFANDSAVKARQVLYLSNLIYSKGIFVFLEAAAQLLENDLELIIKIAGIAMEDEFMSRKAMAAQFNIVFGNLKIKFPERIFYLGRVQGAEKAKILADSAIFVLPTFYKTEAFPVTIIEAMRCGNAIVTTNHNYLPDVISIDNGRLIKVKSSSDLIEKVLSLFSNSEKLKTIQNYNKQEATLYYSPSSYNSSIKRILNLTQFENNNHNNLL